MKMRTTKRNYDRMRDYLLRVRGSAAAWFPDGGRRSRTGVAVVRNINALVALRCYAIARGWL